jgi:hypothetical protein
MPIKRRADPQCEVADFTRKLWGYGFAGYFGSPESGWKLFVIIDGFLSELINTSFCFSDRVLETDVIFDHYASGRASPAKRRKSTAVHGAGCTAAVAAQAAQGLSGTAILGMVSARKKPWRKCSRPGG